MTEDLGDPGRMVCVFRVVKQALKSSGFLIFPSHPIAVDPI
jgi:hypothetical protein